jgi:hypothetical protein
MSVLINKEDNHKIYDRAETLLDEVQSFIGVDMTIDAFVEKDLPKYFYINVFKNKDDMYDFVYNFEVDAGSGIAIVKNAGAPNETIEYNDTVQICIDKNKDSLSA